MTAVLLILAIVAIAVGVSGERQTADELRLSPARRLADLVFWALVVLVVAALVVGE